MADLHSVLWYYSHYCFLPPLLPCANMKASFFLAKSVEISRSHSINRSIEDAKKRKIVKSAYLHSGWLVRLVLVIDILSNTRPNRDPTSCCLFGYFLCTIHLLIALVPYTVRLPSIRSFVEFVWYFKFFFLFVLLVDGFLPFVYTAILVFSTASANIIRVNFKNSCSVSKRLIFSFLMNTHISNMFISFGPCFVPIDVS